jgi:hypothetical protein
VENNTDKTIGEGGRIIRGKNKLVKHTFRQTFGVRRSVDRNTDRFGQTSGS